MMNNVHWKRVLARVVVLSTAAYLAYFVCLLWLRSPVWVTVICGTGLVAAALAWGLMEWDAD